MVVRCKGEFSCNSPNSIIRSSFLNLEIEGNGSRVSGCLLVDGFSSLTENVVVSNSVCPSSLSLAENPRIENCILISTTTGPWDEDGLYSHCLAVGSRTLPEGDGNINGGILTEVFIGGDSPAAQYQLALNSPAIGAGTDGVDMGMFAGDSPYVLSGIPALPRVKTLDVPVVVPDNEGLTFKVEAEARD
jgi:hypothetical protein